ncbi:MAG TPA: Npt1/Npt2 family nucleotide transporter [Polyangiaceae bacterium]|nr:Npt1/Npt2 family nucleotide transporter [Polyangiaceae bacterium]
MPLTPVPASSSSVNKALLGAAALVALTVAGKTARDGLFCAHFPASELPKVMVAGAALSALLAVLTGRLLRSFGPASTLPPLLVLNAIAFIAEHAGLPLAPRAVALILYLHVSAVTGLIISGFWSVVNERFDPHTLRVQVSRIGLGGTIGGIAGGLIAERVAAWSDARHALLALAALSALGAASVALVGGPPTREAPVPEVPAAQSLRTTYVRELALFVGLTALASSVIDFAFKVRAMERYSSAQSLVQFFALFYTGVSLASFLVQAFVTPQLLEKAGLGVGLSVLPAVVTGTALLALILPGLPAQGLLRGADGALTTSLFRSAYEPLYTPLSAERKRSLKAVIDVVVNRMGDGLGSLLAWALVLLVPAWASAAATVAVAVFAVAALVLAARLREGYVAELAASLRSGAVVLNDAQVNDFTTRLTLSRTMQALDRERLKAEIQRLREQEPAEALAAARALTPKQNPSPAALVPAASNGAELSALVADLTSRDVARVRAALPRVEPGLASFVIPLILRSDVGAEAMNVLGSFGGRVTGQLADALLDRERSSPTLRRRLVRVITNGKTAWAAAALAAAFDDPDFEVREHVARGLDELAGQGIETPLLREQAIAGAVRVLSEEAAIPASQRVEHALRVLGLVHDREAFRLAHAALSSEDQKLRGTGLEYLENVLPEAARSALFKVLAAEAVPKSQARRVERDLIDELRKTLG